MAARIAAARQQRQVAREAEKIEKVKAELRAKAEAAAANVIASESSKTVQSEPDDAQQQDVAPSG